MQDAWLTGFREAHDEAGHLEEALVAMHRAEVRAEQAEKELADLRFIMATKRICLCGSTRFRDEYEKAQREETLAGNIVLSVGLFGHAEGLDMSGPIKKMLDELHLRKIDLCDDVVIVTRDLYVGQSTTNEILYARRHNKVIRWSEAGAEQAFNHTHPQ